MEGKKRKAMGCWLFKDRISLITIWCFKNNNNNKSKIAMLEYLEAIFSTLGRSLGTELPMAHPVLFETNLTGIDSKWGVQPLCQPKRHLSLKFHSHIFLFISFDFFCVWLWLIWGWKSWAWLFLFVTLNHWLAYDEKQTKTILRDLFLMQQQQQKIFITINPLPSFFSLKRKWVEL